MSYILWDTGSPPIVVISPAEPTVPSSSCCCLFGPAYIFYYLCYPLQCCTVGGRNVGRADLFLSFLQEVIPLLKPIRPIKSERMRFSFSDSKMYVQDRKEGPDV